MPVSFALLQDTDPKHTSKLTNDWYCKGHMPVLVWLAQGSDIKSFKNPWNKVLNNSKKSLNDL